jgi:hypothetical protein
MYITHRRGIYEAIKQSLNTNFVVSKFQMYFDSSVQDKHFIQTAINNVILCDL